ncbi:MAG: sensor histidine kinase [Croceivirga sp.]
MNGFRLNKSDLKLLVAYFSLSIAWLTYRYISEGYSVFMITTGLIGVIIKVAVLVFVFMYLIQKVLIEREKYFLFLLLVAIPLFVMGYLDLLRDYYTATPPWTWDLSPSEVIIRSFYNSTPDLALPLGLILGKRYYENKINLVELRNAQKEMQLKVLRAQYDPHFLYNSLNTIDALIEHAPKDKVRTYVSHLAGLYRYLIQNKEEDLMPVESEIQIAENYFYLIETRFEQDYQFNIEIKKKPKSKFLPNGSLLTVLENVVKHNQAIKGPIKTEIQVDSDFIRISNTKTLAKKSSEKFGTGLDNLKKRYLLLSNHTISILDEEAKYSINLPLLKTVD